MDDSIILSISSVLIMLFLSIVLISSCTDTGDRQNEEPEIVHPVQNITYNPAYRKPPPRNNDMLSDESDELASTTGLSTLRL